MSDYEDNDKLWVAAMYFDLSAIKYLIKNNTCQIAETGDHALYWVGLMKPHTKEDKANGHKIRDILWDLNCQACDD